jgi:ATP-dependent DNA helicase RecG
MGLNERQVKAVLYVVENGSITNAKYQELFSVSKPTATRDLSELSEKFRVFEKKGVTGAGTTYLLKGS